MAYYYTLRSYTFTETQADDIRGSAVYGVNDEKLGKLDDVIFDPNNGDIRYVIVETGGWLSSTRFIVPADKLYTSAEHEDDFEVNLTQRRSNNSRHTMRTPSSHRSGGASARPAINQLGLPRREPAPASVDAAGQPSSGACEMIEIASWLMCLTGNARLAKTRAK